MTASLPAVFNAQQFTDAGLPASGYRLYTYSPSTTVHKAAYTDAAASTSQTYTNDGIGGQYIALNARGELPAPLYLTAGGYDLALKTPAGASVWTRRAVGVEDSAGGTSTDLASYTDAAKGSGLVGFAAALSYAANTIGEYLKRIVVDATGKVTQSRFEATATDDTGTPDAAFRVNRTLSSGVLDGHGVRDQTTFSRTANSYAAFDAAVTSSGAGTNDHIAGFQSRPVVSRSGGTLTHVYNFTSAPTFNSGTVTNNYGFYAYNPVGSGSVEYNYGFYIPQQTKGSVANYSGYIAQQGASFFCGAPLQINNLVTIDPAAPLFIGGNTTSGTPFVGYNYDPTADDKSVTDVAQTVMFDSAGMRFYVKASGAKLGTTGMRATMTQAMLLATAGDVVMNVNTSAPTLTVNQQMVFALTSNTNLRISVRGTDGTTRTANITLA